MLLFIDYVASKKLILPAMDTVAAGSMRLFEGARGVIHSAFVALVQLAINSGDLRADANPDDFVRALVGVFHTTALPGWKPSARRIVDIFIAGSRSTNQTEVKNSPKVNVADTARTFRIMVKIDTLSRCPRKKENFCC